MSPWSDDRWCDRLGEADAALWRSLSKLVKVIGFGDTSNLPQLSSRAEN